uniref:ORF4' protein n=1 Tax=Simian hemorrhagic fever virus TaxID=38143 RepID=A0A077EKM3_SHFV|nr:ORF4' protein [Simian hemorrhagic fever virus]
MERDNDVCKRHCSVDKRYCGRVLHPHGGRFVYVLCGIVAALSFVPANSNAERCMICTTNNFSTLFTESSYQHYPRWPVFQDGLDYVYHPPLVAQVLGYGETCDDTQIIGTIIETYETITGNMTGIKEAFIALDFADCLLTGILYREHNVTAVFQQQDGHIVLCWNGTDPRISINQIPTPWFISPGALRWATIICACLAIFRAFYS